MIEGVAMNRRKAIQTLVAAAAGCALSAGAAAPLDSLRGEGFPYQAFRRMRQSALEFRGGRLLIAIEPGVRQVSHEVLLRWVARAANAVVAYFGRLPTQQGLVLILGSAGGGVHGGATWGYGGAATRVVVGRDTTEAQLEADWVMVHELMHHAFPSVDTRYDWIEEGGATYVEPIARVQTGTLDAAQMWGELMRDLPQGLPGAGDRGLNRTPTWGRTYWGGALFYLLADMEIHRRTSNRHGLQDALRGVVAEGGNITAQWLPERIWRVADAVTGTDVLATLYDQMKDAPVEVDLAQLWVRLGVRRDSENVAFDDEAPMSDVRRSITARRPNS